MPPIPELRPGLLEHLSKRYRRSNRAILKFWRGAWESIIELLPGHDFDNGFPESLYPAAILLAESQLSKDQWQRSALAHGASQLLDIYRH